MKVLFLCTGNSVRGQPMRLAWSLEDPAAFEGDAAAKLAQFRELRDQIRGQITRLAANAARGQSCPYGQVAVSSSRERDCAAEESLLLMNLGVNAAGMLMLGCSGGSGTLEHPPQHGGDFVSHGRPNARNPMLFREACEHLLRGVFSRRCK